ncbi:MAG: S8 family peptidase [Caldilineaceae bacterium]
MNAKVAWLFPFARGQHRLHTLPSRSSLQTAMRIRLKASSSLHTFTIGVLLVLFCALPLAPNQIPVHIQPALWTVINTQPAAMVTVIVQHTGQRTALDAALNQLGGHVVRDFSLIRALVAQLPAHAVAALGRSPDVRWVSLDSTLQTSYCSLCIDTSRLANAYISTIQADKVWNRAPYLQGQGIGIAVVDSGMTPLSDLTSSKRGIQRLVGQFVYPGGVNGADTYGHGDHISRIIGSNGGALGQYIGVAPEANLINVKVANSQGQAKISDLIGGLQWIFNNQSRFNIRVVNISMNDSITESYHTSALDAAVEELWFNGIVVVVSAGNTGSGGLYAPANDPFVITVGATDDRGTADPTDDVMAPFSAYGLTLDGFPKPDLVAPGTNIVSLIKSRTVTLAKQHPGNIVSSNPWMGTYFRMSGTSMAAPMVSGAAALLIQSNPHLTPDQVKYRLMYTSRPFDTTEHAGAGYLDIDAAVQGGSLEKENQNLEISSLLWDANGAINWNSVTEGSVNWRGNGTAFWGSVNQNSDINNSAIWGSDYWDSTQTAQSETDLQTGGGGQAQDDDSASTTDVTLFNHYLFLPVINSSAH